MASTGKKPGHKAAINDVYPPIKGEHGAAQTRILKVKSFVGI
jgi:hypothetical protein